MWITYLALAGCGDDGAAVAPSPVDAFPPAVLDEATLPGFNWFTPAAALLHALEPVSYLDGLGCPTKTEAGDTISYDGGCSEEDLMWFGRATVQKTGGTTTVIYDGFGSGWLDECGGESLLRQVLQTGWLTWHETAPGVGTFSTSFTHGYPLPPTESCELRQYAEAHEYEGSYQGTPLAGEIVDWNAPQQWSGAGRCGNSVQGSASLRTEEQVVDPKSCPSESQSGRTVVSSAGVVAVIDYDGAVDCSSVSEVTWSNVEPTFDAVGGCALRPPRQQSDVALALLATLFPLARARRRTLRRKSPAPGSGKSG